MRPTKLKIIFKLPTFITEWKAPSQLEVSETAALHPCVRSDMNMIFTSGFAKLQRTGIIQFIKACME